VRPLNASEQHGEPHSPSVFDKGLATIAAWAATLIAGYALWVLSLPAVKADGTCSGIGFGCTPNPRDGALLAGILFGIPLLSACLIAAVIVLVALTRANVRSGLLAGTLATLCGLLLAAMGALVWFG